MCSSTKFTTNLFILFLFHSLATGSYSATFTIVNKCSLTVFPGIFHGLGTSLPPTAGFSLHPGESNVLTTPRSWSGSLWGRTHCSHDSNGKFSCLTGGDCASSTLECNGGNPSSPATFAEFNLNAKSSGFDFFRISLVYGYNLPMMVEPQVGNGSGNCTTTGCMVHLGTVCPSELKVMSGGDCIGCRSVCKPFSKHCSSEFFKKACPHAKVDATKTFQSVCATTDYFITFCPTSTSRIKPSKEKNPTMVDNSGDQKKWSTKDKIVNFFIKNKKLLGIVGGGVGFVVAIVITISCACACNKHGCNCFVALGGGIKSKLPRHLFESTKIEELFSAVERRGIPNIKTTY